MADQQIIGECDGCPDENVPLRRYQVVFLDGSHCVAHYCATCAGLAAANWPGNIERVEQLPDDPATYKALAKSPRELLYDLRINYHNNGWVKIKNITHDQVMVEINHFDETVESFQLWEHN